jgi:lipopolysaccharide export LptBFGC system permease protein LptF
MTDLMVRVKDIFDPATNKLLWLQYYLAMFSRRFDTLIPFSLLISSTILFSSIARKNEQIPLLNAGLSMKRVVFPFFSVAIISMIAMWINGQYVFPIAIQTHEYISEISFGKETELPSRDKMGTMYLSDKSKLFFQQNDPSKKQLYDVFWIPNHNTILHMETLSYSTPLAPEATLVDTLERDDSGVVTKTKTTPLQVLKDLHISEEDVSMAAYPARYMSLSQLLKMIIRMGASSSEKAGDIFITLLLKLLTPFTCLLTVALPINYCLRFNKERHPVLLLFFFIAALFIFQLFVQTSTVLARIPNMPSFLLLSLPWMVAGTLTFRKIKHFFEQV